MDVVFASVWVVSDVTLIVEEAEEDRDNAQGSHVRGETVMVNLSCGEYELSSV